MMLSEGPVSALLDQQRTADACALARQNFQQTPNDPATVNDLAIALWSDGQRDAAFSLLNAASTAAPTWLVGRFNVALMLREAGQGENAARYLEECLQFAPENADVAYELGITYLHYIVAMDALGAAEKYLRRATELRPQWAAAWSKLGAACQFTNREAEAETALRRAVELDPADKAAEYRLAVALMELDRSEEAVEYLRRCADAIPDAKRNLERLTGAKRSGKLARYPRSAKEFGDLPRVIDTYLLPEFAGATPIITKASHTFGLGSCFAVNVSKKLAGFGVDAQHVNHPEEINNTFANRYFLEWLRDGPTNAQTQRLQEVYGDEYRANVRAMIEKADVLIYSLGVAPCFFDKETGEFVMTLGENLHASLLMKSYAFRTTSVQTNADNLLAIIGLIREFNAHATIMLTVSPVPLKATFERKSAIIADCVSKSTLRVACHEVMERRLRDVIYWPSFEIVSWIGRHTGPVFGLDDNSPLHPNEDLIRLVVAKFLSVYGDAEMAAAGRTLVRAEGGSEPQSELEALQDVRGPSRLQTSGG